jgi:hypothetical protein
MKPADGSMSCMMSCITLRRKYEQTIPKCEQTIPARCAPLGGRSKTLSGAIRSRIADEIMRVPQRTTLMKARRPLIFNGLPMETPALPQTCRALSIGMNRTK